MLEACAGQGLKRFDGSKWVHGVTHSRGPRLGRRGAARVAALQPRIKLGTLEVLHRRTDLQVSSKATLAVLGNSK